jgi:hypothetical protein
MVTESRDYTWRDALAAFTRVTEGTDATPPGELAIAESFLRCYIAELEAGRPTADQLKRMADAVEAIRRADSFCLSTYTGPQGLVECDRRRHHTGGHTASVNHTGVIGWDDAEQDGARCPVTVPKPCVLSIRHPGSHRSNSGAEWPALTGRRVVDTLPEVAKLAPDHPAAGRLPDAGETTCPDTAPDDENTQCALVQWHDGPHMDRVAISHAGKAGEVWE